MEISISIYSGRIPIEMHYVVWNCGDSSSIIEIPIVMTMERKTSHSYYVSRVHTRYQSSGDINRYWS